MSWPINWPSNIATYSVVAVLRTRHIVVVVEPVISIESFVPHIVISGSMEGLCTALRHQIDDGTGCASSILCLIVRSKYFYFLNRIEIWRSVNLVSAARATAYTVNRA